MRFEAPLVAACGLVAALLPVACGRQKGPPAPQPAASASASPPPPLALPGGTPCGALGCTQFDSPSAAFLAAAGEGARVLAIGEAHAPKGATATSATKRFTREILPALAGRASDLLVELMMPPTGCAGTTADVRDEQAPATSRQAETNQNEYVVMGERARGLGIVPDMLRPTCGDLGGVRDAGDGAIEASLLLIARLSGAQAARLVDRDARSDVDRGKAVLVYGGLLHNDLSPPPERAAWSYAPALDAHVGGRLVSIDLVVPEFMTDDDSWRSLPWVASYDRAKLGGKTTVLRTGERSFVVIFPESRP